MGKIIDPSWEMFMEAAYRGNLGLMELAKFYRIATPEQKARMDEITNSEDWEGFKALVKEVLGVTLL